MFCTQCGKDNPTAARFCFGCGAQLGPAAAPSGPPLPSAEGTGPFYAGFWRRFAALVLDSLILSVIGGILSTIAVVFLSATFVAAQEGGTGSGGIGAITAGLSAISWLASLACSWLYFSLSEASAAQATLGKRAVGIYVTDLHGQRISLGRATGRWFGRILNTATLCIGWLLAAFTERKQGLHDMIAGTLVVSRERNASPVVVIIILVAIAFPIVIITALVVMAGFVAAAGN